MVRISALKAPAEIRKAVKKSEPFRSSAYLYTLKKKALSSS
jgi:hypothetical protein